jgi:hypothetical protein
VANNSIEIHAIQTEAPVSVKNQHLLFSKPELLERRR